MAEQDLNTWIGRSQSQSMNIALETAQLMQAALNREPSLKDSDPLPLCWHWLYFHEAVQAAELGVEGHPQLGGFMPPVRFEDDRPPRRMWAGGSFEFFHPLRIGVQAEKRSTVTAITPKQGRSGKLVFVIVEHDVSSDGERCFLEKQTIVYREPIDEIAPLTAAKPAPDRADFSQSYQPDPVLLFRCSALTYNAHRIHYDIDYCREQEGYPGLVVHGPLIATLLLDLFVQDYSFSFR